MAKVKNKEITQDELAVAKIIVMFGVLFFLMGYAMSGFSEYFLIGVPAIIYLFARRRGGS